NRRQLISWFSYLKLFLTALWKLPSAGKTIVYRGVKLDLSKDYPEGKTFVWWGFSSTSDSIRVLEAEQFLGKTGTRTLFNIECSNGKFIKNHSYFNYENEVLLMPATEFQVTGRLDSGNGLHIITLKQVESKFPLLEPPCSAADKAQECATNIKELIEIKKRKLSRSWDFRAKELNDEDMAFICGELKSNTNCQSVDLSCNQITDLGTEYLAEMLAVNKTLKRIWFSKNKLTDRSVDLLCNVLKYQNITLKWLAISNHSEITDKSVAIIVDMMKVTTNRYPRGLYCYDNQMSEKGKQKIADVAKKQKIMFFHD
ncbi:unnamed protein product, partial [Didymodactylos carnosus]